MGKSTCTVHVCLRLKEGFYLQRNTEEGLFYFFLIFFPILFLVEQPMK